MGNQQGRVARFVRARSGLQLAVAAFVVCFLVFVPTVSAFYVNTDVAANSLTAWHIAHSGRPWMDEVDVTEHGQVRHFGVGRDGHVVTTRTPGQIWAAVPFYLGSSDVRSQTSFFRGGVAAATLTAAAMALFLLALLLAGLDAPVALCGTAVLAFTTPMWSVSADALWTHPVTVLGIAGAAWSLSRDRWWLAGVFLGIGMTGRVHVALIAAVVGLGLAWRRRSAAPAIGVAVPTLVSLGVLSLWGWYVFGSWDPRGAYAGHEVSSMVPAIGSGAPDYAQNVAGFLVSADRGLLVWTPILVVLLPALIRSWSTSPEWMRWLAVGGVVYTVAQLGLNVFHGGDAFYGYRLGLELLVSVAPLYVRSLDAAGPLARRVLPVALGLQAGAFVVGAALPLRFFVPVDDVWTHNALWNAVSSDLGLAVAFVVAAALTGVVSAREMAHIPQRETSPLVLTSSR